MFHIVPRAEAEETYVYTSFTIWEAKSSEDNDAYKYKVSLQRALLVYRPLNLMASKFYRF